MKRGIVLLFLVLVLLTTVVWAEDYDHIDEILRLDCHGRLHVLPNSIFPVSLDIQHIYEKIVKEAWSTVISRLECKADYIDSLKGDTTCSTYLHESLIPGAWKVSPLMIHQLIDIEQSQRIGVVDGPCDYPLNGTSDFSFNVMRIIPNVADLLGMDVLKIDWPSSCSLESAENGLACLFQAVLLEEEGIADSGIQLRLAIDECPGPLPFLSISCDGHMCDRILTPCVDDPICGPGMECLVIPEGNEREGGIGELRRKDWLLEKLREILMMDKMDDESCLEDSTPSFIGGKGGSVMTRIYNVAMRLLKRPMVTIVPNEIGFCTPKINMSSLMDDLVDGLDLTMNDTGLYVNGLRSWDGIMESGSNIVSADMKAGHDVVPIPSKQEEMQRMAAEGLVVAEINKPAPGTVRLLGNHPLSPRVIIARLPEIYEYAADELWDLQQCRFDARGVTEPLSKREFLTRIALPSVPFGLYMLERWGIDGYPDYPEGHPELALLDRSIEDVRRMYHNWRYRDYGDGDILHPPRIELPESCSYLRWMIDGRCSAKYTSFSKAFRGFELSVDVQEGESTAFLPDTRVWIHGEDAQAFVRPTVCPKPPESGVYDDPCPQYMKCTELPLPGDFDVIEMVLTDMNMCESNDTSSDGGTTAAAPKRQASIKEWFTDPDSKDPTSECHFKTWWPEQCAGADMVKKELQEIVNKLNNVKPGTVPADQKLEAICFPTDNAGEVESLGNVGARFPAVFTQSLLYEPRSPPLSNDFIEGFVKIFGLESWEPLCRVSYLLSDSLGVDIGWSKNCDDAGL